jgi:hypothetical protein
MNTDVDTIATAVLYEGYILYPYRTSKSKHRHMSTNPCGLVQGEQDSVSSTLRTECLVLANNDSKLSVRMRFLHLLLRTGKGVSSIQEATEREAELPVMALVELTTPLLFPFGFPAEIELEDETQRLQFAIEGAIDVSVTRLTERTYRISVEVSNLTQSEKSASADTNMMRKLVSAHVILRVCGGEFVSMTDPPPQLQAYVEQCRNEGLWPILVGEPGSRETILASPIKLLDYPWIDAERPVDSYDTNDINEMLPQGVITLKDTEKEEKCADLSSRRTLERVGLLSPTAVGGGSQGDSRAISHMEPTNGDRSAPPSQRKKMRWYSVSRSWWPTSWPSGWSGQS